MKNDTIDGVTLSPVAQSLLRILIASYFLASSLNVIPGTDLSPLLRPVIPDPYAGAFAASAVFVLAFLVMVGVMMRPAALILGLMTFFASYLRLVELELLAELGSFWRDLALIAALMLSYAHDGTGGHRSYGPFRVKITPRRVRVDPARRAKIAERARARAAASEPPHPVEDEQMMNMFRDDLAGFIDRIRS